MSTHVSPIDRLIDLVDGFLAEMPDTCCDRHVILGWNGIVTAERCQRPATIKHEEYEIQLCERCDSDWKSGKLESYR